MFEEVKLAVPLKVEQDGREVMIKPHPDTHETWWYLIGTLRVSNPQRPKGEAARFSVAFSSQEVVGGFKTSDQVMFVRDRNRLACEDLDRKAREWRSLRKRELVLKSEIDSLYLKLNGGK